MLGRKVSCVADKCPQGITFAFCSCLDTHQEALREDAGKLGILHIFRRAAAGAPGPWGPWGLTRTPGEWHPPNNGTQGP